MNLIRHSNKTSIIGSLFNSDHIWTKQCACESLRLALRLQHTMVRDRLVRPHAEHCEAVQAGPSLSIHAFWFYLGLSFKVIEEAYITFPSLRGVSVRKLMLVPATVYLQGKFTFIQNITSPGPKKVFKNSNVSTVASLPYCTHCKELHRPCTIMN